MGYIRGFVHGTVVGTVVGLCVAPQTGDKTRAQLAGFGRAAREGYGVAEKTVRQVAPMAGAAASLAREQLGRARRSAETDDDGAVIEGNVRIHSEGNGRH
ncbi:MAG: hypothetical protein ACR2GX_06895 [Candidatus Dormibacteria bacterium]